MNDQSDTRHSTPDPKPNLRHAETSGGVVRASGVQIGLLLLLVFVNLLVVWVLWTIINGG